MGSLTAESTWRISCRIRIWCYKGRCEFVRHVLQMLFLVHACAPKLLAYAEDILQNHTYFLQSDVLHILSVWLISDAKHALVALFYPPHFWICMQQIFKLASKQEAAQHSPLWQRVCFNYSLLHGQHNVDLAFANLTDNCPWSKVSRYCFLINTRSCVSKP